jgi:uroporphyrinogen-III synthase
MPRQAARASRAILITRPEPGAAESARAVTALGWEAVLAPALTLATLPFKAPANCQAIIITSRAAARALPPAKLPVIAVGEAARPSAALPQEACETIREGRIHAALFTSPRSAQEAMRLLRDTGMEQAAQNIIAIALSPRIAVTLATLPWAEIRTASQPDHAALLACLGTADVLRKPS